MKISIRGNSQYLKNLSVTTSVGVSSNDVQVCRFDARFIRIWMRRFAFHQIGFKWMFFCFFFLKITRWGFHWTKWTLHFPHKQVIWSNARTHVLVEWDLVLTSRPCCQFPINWFEITSRNCVLFYKTREKPLNRHNQFLSLGFQVLHLLSIPLLLGFQVFLSVQ